MPLLRISKECKRGCIFRNKEAMSVVDPRNQYDNCPAILCLPEFLSCVLSLDFRVTITRLRLSLDVRIPNAAKSAEVYGLSLVHTWSFKIFEMDTFGKALTKHGGSRLEISLCQVVLIMKTCPAASSTS